MKKFKLLVLIAAFATSQMNAVDIPKNLQWCGVKVATYGNDLLYDTATQLTTVGTVGATIAAYQYYYYQAALACLDGHPNSKIMHRANLIYVPYSEFLDMAASANSYAHVVEFMNTYCTTCYALSDAKVNRLVALITDLQINNNKQLTRDVTQENMILEQFKENVLVVQENMRQELINDAISSSTRVNNAVSVRIWLDTVELIARLFR